MAITTIVNSDTCGLTLSKFDLLVERFDTLISALTRMICGECCGSGPGKSFD
jgi:hypothetical protein